MVDLDSKSFDVRNRADEMSALTAYSPCEMPRACQPWQWLVCMCGRSSESCERIKLLLTTHSPRDSALEASGGRVGPHFLRAMHAERVPTVKLSELAEYLQNIENALGKRTTLKRQSAAVGRCLCVQNGVCECRTARWRHR